MTHAIPLQTYNDGDVFDADAYEVGTLVIFRVESLTGQVDKLPCDIPSLIGESLPARPFDVSPSFGPTSTTETVRANDISYFTAAKWGIVSVDKARRKRLSVISTGLVDRRDAKVIIASPTLFTHFSPVEIGETRHYLRRDDERLERVNALDVVTYGETEKKARGVKNIAARLSFLQR